MKYLSLFSGIGGFEIPMQKLNWECVGFSEIDPYAIKVYENHFPKHINYGDITKIIADDLPDFDLICGGFPCQSFSIAGKRRGFEDTRGTLFFEIARIVRAKRPRYIFLENVKGLLSHDEGYTFSRIISAIDELGYDCQWEVLNSKNFGVPQNRERVFIIGHLRGTPRPQVFPFERANRENSSEYASNTIDANYWKGIDNHGARTAIVQLNNPVHSNDRIYGEGGVSPTLNTMQGGNRQPFVALTEKRSEEAKKIRRETKDRDYSPRRSKEIQARTDGKIGAITASRNLDNLLSDEVRVRKLTPTECERLQGFPDGWTEGISDSQRYKCLGNAVTVNVIDEIIKKIK